MQESINFPVAIESILNAKLTFLQLKLALRLLQKCSQSPQLTIELKMRTGMRIGIFYVVRSAPLVDALAKSGLLVIESETPGAKFSHWIVSWAAGVPAQAEGGDDV